MLPPLATLPELHAYLLGAPDLPLTFVFADGHIAGGLHITELRAARIDAIDCGGNRDDWRETVLEVLDGGAAPMSARKAAEILDRSLSALPQLAEGRLIVAATPGNGPLRRSTVTPDLTAEALRLHLSPERAQCKPAQVCCPPRAQADHQARADHQAPQACCTPGAN
ncbi:MAG: DUF6428 family protein [Pseudomonadota bacterium]